MPRHWADKRTHSISYPRECVIEDDASTSPEGLRKDSRPREGTDANLRPSGR